jgi:hypothetical protein
MDNKDLMTPGNDSVNPLTIQNLPIELAELSEEVLSQVRGGLQYAAPFKEEPVPCCTVYPPGWPFTFTISVETVYPGICKI